MRVALIVLLLLIAPDSFFAAGAAPDAQTPNPGDRLKPAPAKTMKSWSTGLSIDVPEHWHVISDDPDNFMIGEKPQSVLNVYKIAWLRLGRTELGEDAADQLAKRAQELEAQGAEVTQRKLADKYQVFLLARRTSYFHSNAGKESRGTSVLSVAFFAHGSDMITMTWQMPEDDFYDQHVAVFKKIVHTIKIGERGKGDWPLPQDAIKIDKLPYTLEQDLQAGDAITFVLPNGKTFAVWARYDSGIAEQRSNSGILSTYGYRPYFNGPRDFPGEEVDTPYDYIENQGVSTGGKDNTRTRRITCDIYHVTTVEQLNPKDRLPFKITIRKTNKAD